MEGNQVCTGERKNGGLISMWGGRKDKLLEVGL